MLAWARLAGGGRSGTFFGDGAAARATREDLARQGDGAERCDRALGGHAQVLLGVCAEELCRLDQRVEERRDPGPAFRARAVVVFRPWAKPRIPRSGVSEILCVKRLADCLRTRSASRWPSDERRAGWALGLGFSALLCRCRGLVG